MTDIVVRPVTTQIKEILEENTIDDLKSLMSRRHYLNRCNIVLMYLFYFIQSAGIMTTTIATGYNYTYLIWIGVGMNILASLLNVYEKVNANLLKTYMKDINDIKSGKFVDEGAVEKPDDTANQPTTPSTKQTANPLTITTGA